MNSPHNDPTDSVSTRGPAAGTPLQSLNRKLSGRIFNALMREGFRTVEQVAGASDAELHAISVLGWASVQTIRRVIAADGALRYRVDADRVVLDADQIEELAALLSALVSYATALEQQEMKNRATAFIDTLPLTRLELPED